VCVCGVWVCVCVCGVCVCGVWVCVCVCVCGRSVCLIVKCNTAALTWRTTDVALEDKQKQRQKFSS